MALQGEIKEFGLNEILQLIQIQKREGALRLRNSKTEAMLLFEGGAVVMARSENEDEWQGIADLLVGSKIVSAGQVQEALREIKNGGARELGPLLVAKGFVSKEDLEKVGKVFVQERLFELISWKSGSYAFEARAVNYNKAFFSPLNTEFILMEGARRHDEWPRLLKEIPSQGVVFERTGKQLDASNEASKEPSNGEGISFEGLNTSDGKEGGLGSEALQLLSLVDGTKAVSSLISLSLRGEFSTYQALAELKEKGYIQIAQMAAGRTAVQPQLASIEAPVKRDYGHRTIQVLLNGILASLVALLIFLSVKKINLKDPFSMNAFQPFHELIIGEKLDRVQYALHLFHLRYQRFPDRLVDLVRDADLSESDLVDPWGQPWEYHATDRGFLLGSHRKSPQPD